MTPFSSNLLAALEGVEVLFASPPEEWIALPHRPMRCDHAMLNVAANVGLASEDPPPSDTARHFTWTGLATLRSSWDREATYVGFKCGPSDVGHSHLGANSLVLSSRGERLLVDAGLWP